MDANAIRVELTRAQAQRSRSVLAKLLTMPGPVLLSRLARVIGPIGRRARLVCGEQMDIVLPDLVSSMLYAYGYFDATVCYMMLDHVRPGETVFDVGSHFGFFTLLAATLVGPGGQVHFFEPTPNTFGMVKGNTARLDHVRANNCAVCDVEGETEFSDFGVVNSGWNTLAKSRNDAITGSAKRIKVKTTTLDRYCTANGVRPDFIKIDAENAEPLILKGMSTILGDGKKLAIGLEAGDELSTQILDVLRPYGMKMFIYDEDGRRRESSDPVGDITHIKDVLFVR